MSDPEQASAGDPPPWHGVQGVILVITLLVLLALGGMVVNGARGGRDHPLQVAVLPPIVPAAGELGERRRELLVEAILDSTDRALAARNGLRASLIGGDPAVGGDPATGREGVALALAGGAEEGLKIEIDCTEKPCRAALERLRAVDGSVLWRRGFGLDTSDWTAVDEKLATELNLAYLKFDRRPGGARLFCPPEPYQSYLGVLADRRHGRISARQSAAVLADLRSAAPRFHGLYLREAEQRLQLENPGEHGRAVDLLHEARRIAPGDLRAPTRLAPLLLIAGDRLAAQEVLDHLRRLSPRDERLEEWQHHADDKKNEPPTILQETTR